MGQAYLNGPTATAGRPGHRDIWRIAAPMILSNVSIPLLGMVDTAVVGHLPEPHYIGAVAVGAVIFSFVFWGFGFLRMGTTGFVAQAHGGGVPGRVQTKLAQAGLIALVLGFTILAAQAPIREVAFALIAAGGEVEREARAYFAIRIWAAPATLMTYVLVGWFLGTQNARAPLAIMLGANLTNIVLDLLFVPVLGWGVAGVAVASVISEYLALGIGLALVWRSGKLVPGLWRWAEIRDLAQLRAILRVNADIMLRTLCLIFALSFFVRQGARQGELILAANAVLMNFQHFMAYALDGFAHAAEAFVGDAIGARNQARLKRAIALTGRWTLGIAAVIAGTYALGGELLIAALTDLAEVRDQAARYLPWLVVSPLISAWSFWLDGVFIGATRGQEMRNTMLLATFGAYLPAWWLLASWGNHGLWAAFLVFLAARGIGLGLLLPRLRGAISS